MYLLFPIYYQTQLSVNSIEILDMRGRFIERINNPQGELNITRFPAALYFLRFHTDEGNFYKRMIIED